MSDEFDGMEGMEEEVIEVQEHDLMELFETLSFQEKWARVKDGLKMPPDSGEYKWAKLQMIRLFAPAAAIVVPGILMVLIGILAAFKPMGNTKMQVKMLDPEEIPELDEIEEIIEEPPEPPDPVEVDFEPDVDIDTPTPQPPTEFSPQPAKFDSVAMVKSPVIMKNIYGSRSPGMRGAARAAYGGNGATEGAVMRALRWLKKYQNSDGSWNASADGGGKSKEPKAMAAYTGMALLSYLAHGETPASPEFGPTTESAIKFLVGNMGGDTFGARDNHNYTHPIATYALCEAYGLTKVPTIRDAAEKGINKIINGQNASGGWDYNCKGGTRDDTSYMGWCAQALKAAKMADIFSDNSKVIAGMSRALDGFRKNSNGNGFGYCDAKPTGLTGVGVLCMQLLGAAQDPAATGGLAWLEQNASFDWPNFGKLKTNPIYYTYYITQAKFHHGGDTWNKWNAQFATGLVKNQVRIDKEASGYTDHKGKPQEIGYWDSPSEQEHTGGRTQDTCLSALQLQVYYRYLPTFKAPETKPEAGLPTEAEVAADDDIEIEIL